MRPSTERLLHRSPPPESWRVRRWFPVPPRRCGWCRSPVVARSQAGHWKRCGAGHIEIVAPPVAPAPKPIPSEAPELLPPPVAPVDLRREDECRSALRQLRSLARDFVAKDRAGKRIPPRAVELFEKAVCQFIIEFPYGIGDLAPLFEQRWLRRVARAESQCV